MNLSGRAVLISGGARMGASVAALLASRGMDVALTYRRSRAAADAAARAVRAHGRRAALFRADMTREPDVRKALSAAAGSFGRLDGLVNMVSIYEKTPWPAVGGRVWGENMAANLGSAHYQTLHAAPLMRRGGRIVHFADWVAASGRPTYKGFAPYYAAKRGLIGLAEAQALELAPRILVNCVAPGPILPPKGATKAAIRAVERATPLGRWGGPDAVAAAVLFFFETDFVTGECLRVDGGRHLL